MAILCIRPLEVDDLTVAELIALTHYVRLLNNLAVWGRVNAALGSAHAEVRAATKEAQTWGHEHFKDMDVVAHLSRAAIADIRSYAAHS